MSSSSPIGLVSLHDRNHSHTNQGLDQRLREGPDEREAEHGGQHQAVDLIDADVDSRVGPQAPNKSSGVILCWSVCSHRRIEPAAPSVVMGRVAA